MTKTFSITLLFIINNCIILSYAIKSFKERSTSLDGKLFDTKMNCNKQFAAQPFTVYGRPYYECNGFIFNKYKDAKKYCKRLAKNDRSEGICLPEGATKPQEPEIFLKFHTPSYIKPYAFSNNIWNSVWSKCPYSCFSKENFSVLKKKINEYRKFHRSNKLSLHSWLGIKAQEYALKFAKNKLVYHIVENKYGIIFGYYKSEAANLIVKRWYSKSFCYNYKWLNPCILYDPFTQMVWKRSTQLGLGVVEKDKNIFVVAVYYPKGNILGKFLENVFPLYIQKSKKPNHVAIQIEN